MSTKGLRGQAFLLSVAMSTRALRHGAFRQERGSRAAATQALRREGPRETPRPHLCRCRRECPRNAAKGSLPRRAGGCVRSACAKRVSWCLAAVCGDQPHFSGSVFLCSSNRSLPERAAGQKPCLGGFDAQCGHGLLPPKGAGCLCVADTLHHDLLSLHPLSVIIFNAFFGVESKITEIAA